MRKTWSKDQIRIINEFISILEHGIPLSLCGVEGSIRSFNTKIQYICGYEGKDYLVLNRPKGWESTNNGLVFYKNRDQLVKGFNLSIIKKSENQLAALIPDEIFQLERRKYARIDTPGDSKATFLIRNKRKINIFKVKNISLTGACLVGILTHELKKGDEIDNVTLSLEIMTYRHEILEFTLPVATVARIVENKKGPVTLGIRFSLTKNEIKLLDNYMDLRILDQDQIKLQKKNNGTE